MPKKELIVFKDPKSPISEIFKTLRTNIQFMNSKEKARTILITSTFAGEGKSWVTSNIAVSFAQTGKKVLLMDADMRKGRQYTIFDVSPKPGLSDYLSETDDKKNEKSSDNLVDYLQATDIDGLYILTAGSIPPNPSELLITTKMTDLLENAKQKFDIIIIDSTPSQLVTDAFILSRMVSSTIIVTAYNSTKKEDLKKIISNIQNVGGRIDGIILNKVPISENKYTERYYMESSFMKVERINEFKKVTDIPNKKDVQDKRNNVSKNKIEDKSDDIIKQVSKFIDENKKV